MTNFVNGTEWLFAIVRNGYPLLPVISGQWAVISREMLEVMCWQKPDTNTHDPFVLSYGHKRLFADLGASRLISAEKGEKRIVVEIKSFLSDSDIYDLEQAIGQ